MTTSDYLDDEPSPDAGVIHLRIPGGATVADYGTITRGRAPFIGDFDLLPGEWSESSGPVIYRNFGEIHTVGGVQVRPAGAVAVAERAPAPLALAPAPAIVTPPARQVVVRGLAVEWAHWFEVRRNDDHYLEHWAGPQCIDPASRPVLQLGHERGAPIVGDAVDVWPSPMGLRVQWALRPDLVDNRALRDLLSRPCELSIGFNDVTPPVRRKMPNPTALDQVERTRVRVDHVAIVRPGTAAYRSARTEPVPYTA